MGDEDIRSPGGGFTQGCELPDMGARILMQEQRVFSITESTLQPLAFPNVIKGGIYNSDSHDGRLFVNECTCVPQGTCGCQRTTCRSCSFPSILLYGCLCVCV